MGVAGVNGAGNYQTYPAGAANYTRGRDANQTADVSGGVTYVLHGQPDAGEGEQAVASWVDCVSNTSYCIYKTQDFDPEHPVYKVKTWDAGGNVTERLIDASKVDPKNCDYLELRAYCADLREKGADFKDTVLNSVVAYRASRAGSASQQGPASNKALQKDNWLEVIYGVMDMQKRAGNWDGYLSWKRFLEAVQEADPYPNGIDMEEDIQNGMEWDEKALEAAKGEAERAKDKVYESTAKCRYAAESAKDDPVVEVSTVVNGQTVTEKIHVNDINPKHATKQEMQAFFYHQDMENGTQNSYLRFESYLETAQKQGYFDGTYSYEEYAGKEQDWIGILENVRGDCARLGLYKQRDEIEKWINPMQRAFIRHFDFANAKGVDMSDQAFYHFDWPDLPEEIFQSIFASVFSEENLEKYDEDDRLTQIWAHIMAETERRLNENGGRNDRAKAWDTAISVVEEMLTKLDGYFGDKLGSQRPVKLEVERMRNCYNNIIDGLKKERDKALGTGRIGGQDNSDGEDEDKEDEEEDYRNYLMDYIAELYEKIVNGEAVSEFPIGSLSLTLKEWDKLLERFDDIQEEIRLKLKEEIARRLAEQTGQTQVVSGTAYGTDIAQEISDAKDAAGGKNGASGGAAEGSKTAGTGNAARTATDSSSLENAEAANGAEKPAGAEETNTKTDSHEVFLTAEIQKSVFQKADRDRKEIAYITAFTPDGIICKRAGRIGEDFLWKMDYSDAGDHEKVMSLMHSFPSDWNLRFASNERFWKDYLGGEIDTEDFIEHMNLYTDKGDPNYLIERNGSTYVNREALKYSKYLNSPELKAYTLDELMAAVGMS